MAELTEDSSFLDWEHDGNGHESLLICYTGDTTKIISSYIIVALTCNVNGDTFVAEINIPDVSQRLNFYDHLDAGFLNKLQRSSLPTGFKSVSNKYFNLSLTDYGNLKIEVDGKIALRWFICYAIKFYFLHTTDH